MSYLANVSKIARVPRPAAQVDTPNVRQAEPQRKPLQSSKIKYILNFAVFGLRFSRENTKASKKNLTFATFCPVSIPFCHRGVMEERKPLLYGEHTKGTPPPIRGAARALHPHNFSHQKYSKKSPWSDWKKFRKKFAGKCFGGKGKPPIL